MFVFIMKALFLTTMFIIYQYLDNINDFKSLLSTVKKFLFYYMMYLLQSLPDFYMLALLTKLDL